MEITMWLASMGWGLRQSFLSLNYEYFLRILLLIPVVRREEPWRDFSMINGFNDILRKLLLLQTT